MTQSFIYSGKNYTTNNLDSKLSKMGITLNDITLIDKTKPQEIDTSIKKYYFYNEETKHTIVSIYPSLDNLQGIINIEEWKMK